MRPADLTEVDRILDGLDADLAEVDRDVAAARRHIRHVRSVVEIHRSAQALPSDALLDDLIRGRAAVIYARHRSERDAVALARIRRLLWPTWWERWLDVWRGVG